MRTLILVLAMIFQASLPGPEATGQNVIHVDVTGFRSNKGQVMCGLYSSADGFAKDGKKALAQAQNPVSNGRGFCEFNGIQPGTYAIAVFHDENSNGKLDTNFLGIPREGVGASNDAKGHFGPPKFEDAKFRFGSGRLELKITMYYL